MLFIKNKHAATEWTIGKLMTIILAVVLLTLIIYGVSTGGINPLVENAKGMFDNILSLFGAGEDGDGEGQIVTRLVTIPGVGNGTLTISKDNCKIEFDYGPVYNFDYDSKDLEQWDFGKKKYIRHRTIFFWSEDVNLANWTRNLRKTLMEKEYNFIFNYNNTNYSISFFELLDTFEETEEFYNAVRESLNKEYNHLDFEGKKIKLLFFEGKKGWFVRDILPLLYFTPRNGWFYGIDSEDFLYERKFGAPSDEWFKFEKRENYIYVLDQEWEILVKNTKIKQFLDEEC